MVNNLNTEYNERQQLRDKRIITLQGEIFCGGEENLIEDFTLLSLCSNDPIRLIISCEGGDVYSGLSIMRAIRKVQQLEIQVIGDVVGHALSMAFIILQCCDKRIMGKSDILMCHGGSAITVGDLKNIEAERKLMMKLQDDFSRLIAERSTSSVAEYREPGFWHAVLEDGTPQFYDIAEALEMGLIDVVE